MDLQTVLNQAQAHRQAGNIEGAVQAYLQVLEHDPTHAEARQALGPILLALKAPNDRSAAWLATGAVIAAIAFAAGWAACHWLTQVSIPSG